ncbi:MAG: site-2 protease family protein [Tepidisphaeraceae bacterium]
MAWDERPHYRDRSGASTNPLLWLVNGSVRIVSALGVEVRAHSSLIVFILAILLLDWNYRFPVRVFSTALWTLLVMVHEYAHCLTARRLGGDGDEALLWPAGGLTPAQPPQRAGATFLTAAAGPMLNLLLCVASAIAVYQLTPTGGIHRASSGAGHVMVSLNPFHGPSPDFSWSDPAFYCGWMFLINYRLLLLNLLPIFPLDGGRMLQAMLSPITGNFQSMLIEANVGMVGAVVVGLVALALQGWFLVACMTFCCYESYRRRLALHDAGEEDWRDSVDFSGSLFTEDKPRRRRLSRRVIRRARKIAMAEKAARDRIDAILAKVSARGMASLTWLERRTLRKATEQHRRSETEISRIQ